MFNDDENTEQQDIEQQRREQLNNNIKKFDFNSMYRMALSYGLTGCRYLWPIQKYRRDSFIPIEDAMADTEKPVFCFIARIDRSLLTNWNSTGGSSQNNNNYNNGNQPDNEYQQKSRGTGIFKSIGSFLFGFLKPFDPSQVWCTFCLTDKNRLYFSHYTMVPLLNTANCSSMKLDSSNTNMEVVSTISNPYYSKMTIGAINGDYRLSFTWKKNDIRRKIYPAIHNNVERNGKKIEDENGNIIY